MYRKQLLLRYLKDENFFCKNVRGSFAKDAEKISNLIKKISLHEYDDHYFNSQGIEFNLCYLIMNNGINYDDVIDAFMYLTILIQCRKNNQTMSKEDLDLTLPASVKLKLHKLNSGSINKKITFILKHIIKFYTNLYPLVRNSKHNELDKKIIMLFSKPFVLFELSMKTTDMTDNYIITTLLSFVPSIKDNDSLKIFIPCYSLIKELIFFITEHESLLKPALVYGELTYDDLLELHRNKIHPLNLYSSFIKSNPKYVHEHRLGPIPMFIHDILHIIGCVYMRESDHAFIYHCIIPILFKIKDTINIYIKNNNIKIINKMLDKIINLVNDIAVISPHTITTHISTSLLLGFYGNNEKPISYEYDKKEYEGEIHKVYSLIFEFILSEYKYREETRRVLNEFQASHKKYFKKINLSQIIGSSVI